MKIRIVLLHALSIFVGAAGYFFLGFTLTQSIIMSIFSMSMLGTLLFWEFRLSFVFIGSGVLFLIHAVDLPRFIEFASLDVILFLIGMMIIVAMMNDAGFFFWILTAILRTRNLDGRKLFVLIMVVSALLSGLMDEVTSIIVMATVVFSITSLLEMRPVPLLLASILATNIGSASTVLGNPIGVLIALRGNLSFEDFLVRAAPLSAVILAVTIVVVLFWYRNYIREMTVRLRAYTENVGFLHLISVPADRMARTSMVVFGITIVFIALHKRLAILLGIESQGLLMMVPVIGAGAVMLFHRDRARHFVEREVEWNSLLFFIFLFAQAGVLRSSGVADVVATRVLAATGHDERLITGAVLFSSGILSSVLDNVVVVSAYVPIVKSMEVMELNLKPLWWAMLFGACYGGNITMIGSTANIVALGLLEKKTDVRVRFRSWLKIGVIVGAISMAIAYLALVLLPIYGR